MVTQMKNKSAKRFQTKSFLGVVSKLREKMKKKLWKLKKKEPSKKEVVNLRKIN